MKPYYNKNSTKKYSSPRKSVYNPSRNDQYNKYPNKYSKDKQNTNLNKGDYYEPSPTFKSFAQDGVKGRITGGNYNIDNKQTRYSYKFNKYNNRHYRKKNQPWKNKKPARPRRLDSDLVAKLNRDLKIKFWINRDLARNYNIGFNDFYVIIRKRLIRRSNLTIAFSPYFSKFLQKHKILKRYKSRQLVRLENLSPIDFFGKRLLLYALLKRRWYKKPYKYKTRFYWFLSLAKLRYLVYLNRAKLKSSPLTKKYFRKFRRSSIFWIKILKRKRIFKKLFSNVAIFKSFLFSAKKHNFRRFFSGKTRRSVLDNKRTTKIFDYLLNTNLKHPAYNIFRQPNINRLVRENKKYKVLAGRIRIRAYRKLTKQVQPSYPVITVRSYLNNLFIYVYNRKKLIFSASAGMTLPEDGLSRRTGFARSTLIHSACHTISQLGFKMFDLRIVDNSLRRMHRLYRKILKKRQIYIRHVICAKSIAHNGIRAKKARRL